MLTAVLFVIRMTSRALGIFLNLDVKLTDSSTIKMYWLIVLPFILYGFIKFFYVITGASVDTHAPSYEAKIRRANSINAYNRRH